MNMIKQKHPLIVEKKQADLFRILAHPVRLAILKILAEDEACVCHIEAALGYRQAYLSQQLAVLREKGLIQDRRDGWNVYYQLTDTKLLSLIALSEDQLGENLKPSRLTPLTCPCPKCSGKFNMPCCD
jgi:ArsR family transcriptional regulator